MPEKGCWSYIYHLDGREAPNESLPAWDTFYSLNVILGLAACSHNHEEKSYDLEMMLKQNAQHLLERPVPTYAFGMALWAAAELGKSLEAPVYSRIRNLVFNRKGWVEFRAQDIGLLLSGISQQKMKGSNDFEEEAHALYHCIKQHYLAPSGLFYDTATGFRKNFSSFATQTYLITSFYHYGTAYGNEEALALADASVKKLMLLQGPEGEWPWFYNSSRGIVIDNYEVYSVHQGGMAPLFLAFAEKRGIPGAHEAIIKGFNWLFGNNQLKQSMMIPEKGMFYRSIIRKGELISKKRRIARAIVNSITGTSDHYAPPSQLTLRKECRSYELGWMLYSFGSRTDLPQITEHPEFITANNRHS
ncbi:MAG TPA: hypothetical protein VFT64_09145 [Rickettsiales bacterium]|nr:hypothetical protein [Rickettsiales bacterium]